MRLSGLVLLAILAVSACSASRESVPLEAPDVHFQKAIILAAVAPENRQQVEELAAAEIERRRPQVEAIPTWKLYPDIEKISAKQFRAYLQAHGIDLVVTIVPFAEVKRTSYDDWSDVSREHLGHWVEGLDSLQALAGRIGVQVVAWDVDSGDPVYAKTSQVLVGEIAGPAAVAEFTAVTVTRDI